MKLSEMTIKEFKIKSTRLIPLMRGIVKDKDVLDILYRKINLEAGLTEIEINRIKMEYKTDKYLDLAALLLDKHEETFYNILAVVYGCSSMEVQNWTLSKFVEAIAELGEDEGFNKLFTFAHR